MNSQFIMNMKIMTTLLLMGASVVSGLSCWSCQNARSVLDCIDNGTTEKCLGDSSKMCCQTEVRFHEGWGGSHMITTGCKESTACSSNYKQNKATSSMKTQCNPYKRNSVCRCRCKGFQCNRSNLLCRQRPLSNKVNLKVLNDEPQLGELNEFQVERLPQSFGGIFVNVIVPKKK